MTKLREHPLVIRFCRRPYVRAPKEDYLAGGLEP